MWKCFWTTRLSQIIYIVTLCRIRNQCWSSCGTIWFIKMSSTAENAVTEIPIPEKGTYLPVTKNLIKPNSFWYFYVEVLCTFIDKKGTGFIDP